LRAVRRRGEPITQRSSRISILLHGANRTVALEDL